MINNFYKRSGTPSGDVLTQPLVWYSGATADTDITNMGIDVSGQETIFAYVVPSGYVSVILGVNFTMYPDATLGTDGNIPFAHYGAPLTSGLLVDILSSSDEQIVDIMGGIPITRNAHFRLHDSVIPPHILIDSTENYKYDALLANWSFVDVGGLTLDEGQKFAVHVRDDLGELDLLRAIIHGVQYKKI